MALHLGEHIFEGPHAIPDHTIEDLTIQVDPNTGTDFASGSLVRMNRQSDFTAHGAFASYKGAIEALPSNIRHSVRLVHATGAFSIGPEYFGNLSRLNFNQDGYLLYDSTSGLVPVSASPTMTYLNDINGYTITMIADPGVPDNTYQGKWLKVVSGSQVGEYKAIRRHSGTIFEVAGRFSGLDGTSAFQIVTPSVTLDFGGSTWFAQLFGIYSVGGAYDIGASPENEGGFLQGLSIIFGAIRILGSYTWWSMDGIAATFWGTIIQGITLDINGSSIELDHLILDGLGEVDPCVWVENKGLVRGGSSESGWLIRNSAGNGIKVYGDSPDSMVYLYKGSIDNCVLSAVLLGRGLHDFYSGMRSYGNGGYGIDISGAPGLGNYGGMASMFVDLTYTGDTEYCNGVLGDINLDGAVISYADVAAEPDQTIIGADGSVVKGY